MCRYKKITTTIQLYDPGIVLPRYPQCRNLVPPVFKCTKFSSSTFSQVPTCSVVCLILLVCTKQLRFGIHADHRTIFKLYGVFNRMRNGSERLKKAAFLCSAPPPLPPLGLGKTRPCASQFVRYVFPNARAAYEQILWRRFWAAAH